MREIKFRGKRIDTHEWVFGFPVMVNGGWFMLPFGTRITQHSFWGDYGAYGMMGSGDVPDLVGHDVQEDNGARMCQVISGTIGQFAGLKDQLCRDIYEGDIVYAEVSAFGNFNGAYVKFANGEFCFYKPNDQRVTQVDTDCYTVIGNIHDNQDLLS